jgi:pilus assembly protein CpaE
MLTAAIVGTDATSSSSLRAALQQTGLVLSVREWGVSIETYPSPGEGVPNVVLLDLTHEAEPYFIFAAHVHRLQPAARIILLSPMQPDPGLLLQAMRGGVQEFLSKPVDVEALRDILARFAKEKEDAGAHAAEKLIVVMGAKGGVGTTTVAANLGVQLAQVSRKHVVLLDFARSLGHVSLLLDLQPRFSLRDAIENLDRLDEHFFGGLLCRHRTGLEVLAGTSHPEEWERISATALARVVNVAYSSSDYVVMDSGAHYTSEWSPILRTARAILLVAEANVPSLWSLERHLAATAALGIATEQIGIVINRWSRADEDTLKNVEKRTKRQIFRIPNDYRQASEAANIGVPLAGNHNNALVSKFRQLASELAGIALPPTPEKRSAFANLFSFNPTK